MKSLNRFITEANRLPKTKRVSDDLMLSFGRHNPPHLGHKKILDLASSLSEDIGADKRFYTSQSQDPKQNPLPFLFKLKQLMKMFPEHADSFDGDQGVKTILNAATKGYNDGYKNLHFTGGGDSRDKIENLLRKYNGQLFNFNNIYSHEPQEEEDPEGESFLSQLSSSKMRKFAQGGDIMSFLQGLPIGDSYTEDDGRELFSMLRSMLSEGNDWEIDQVSHKDYLREIYKSGRLYKEGDLVESLITGLIGEIHRCGTNHVICVTEDGVMFKSFIHDVHLI